MKKGSGIRMTQNKETTMEGVFFLTGKDFTNAGAASCELKGILEKMQVEHSAIRRAAIAAFEAEMNIIIYTPAGMMKYSITPDHVKIVFQDMGHGIEDIELAMTEGYSTAPDYIREMGFGSGMGLPNIKKNTDEMKISSVPGAGTTLEFIIKLRQERDNENL